MVYSRRDLFKTGSALMVSFAFGTRVEAQTGTDAALGKPVDPTEVDSFLAVHADGSVTVYTGKVDLGTGLRIAIRQMAAEELELPVERVSLVEGDTALTPDQGGTGGSTGLTRGGVEVRQAAATAREALRKMTPADLASGKRFNMKVDPKAPLKDPKTYKVVGQPVLRPEIPFKATGRHPYVQDFTTAGMLHARVIHPPAAGAKLLSVDEASIRAIPDVRVVRIENFLGVVAKDEWAAVRAARELKATWGEGPALPGSENLDAFVRQGAIDRDEAVVNRGNSATAMAGAVKKLSATYYWPNQGHASLGPSCAVADVRDGGATVWSSVQASHALRLNLAKIFALPPAKVRVVYMDGAGCYGGNGNDDVAADAVLLSKAVGSPVRVQWMRQDEHGWDPKGPQQLLDMRAGLDAQGNIAAWEAEMWVPMNKPGGRPLLSIDAAGMAQDHGQGAGLMTQNADPPYAAPHVRVVAHYLKDTPLRPSNLRAPGKIANVFAVEAFTDELAAAAGVDPVEYRLRGLTDPRAIAVIRRTADMFGWQPKTTRSRQPGSRPRLRLRALQASGKLRCHGDGSGRRPLHRPDSSAPRGLRARLRVDRESQRATQSGGRFDRANAQPHHPRRSEVRSLARHQRRLGQLSDSAFPRSARDRSGAARSSRAAALRRGRSRRRNRARRFGQCDLRCHRSAPAARSVYS